MRKFLVTSIFLVAAGCTRVTVMRYAPVVYPPNPHAVTVTHDRPTRPYVELAELRAPASRSDAIIRLSEEAQKLGADALILGPTVTTGATLQRNLMTGQVLGASNDEAVTAIAIRWRDRPE